MAERSPKMLELMDRLLLQTQRGSLHWTSNRSSLAQFETKVGEATVTIVSQDADGNHPFTLRLWRPGDPDAEGKRPWTEIERLNSLDTVATGDAEWTMRLGELWRVARADALKVDQNLDAVLAELGPA